MNELFGDNRTKLAAVAEAEVDIPIMPGVSAATGLYEAMMDSMKSDLAIFEAMMKMDAIELKMRREGTFNESVADTIKSGASKLVTMIVEGLKKLASWIKSAVSAFTLAILKKLDSDKLLIAEYGKEVVSSDKAGEVTIKWRTPVNDETSFGVEAAKKLAESGFNRQMFEMMSNVTSDYEKTFWDQVAGESLIKPMIDKGIDAFFKGEAKDIQLKAVGAKNVVDNLSNFRNRISTFSKVSDNITKLIDKSAREVEQYLNKYKVKSDVTDDKGKKIGSTSYTTEPEKVNFISKAFSLYKNSITSVMNATKDYLTYDYKQNKAAFMKAVGAVTGVKNEAALDSFIEEEMNDIDAVLADTTSDEVIEILNKQTSMDTEMDDDEIGVDEPKEEAPAEEEPSYTAEEAAFFEAPLF